MTELWTKSVHEYLTEANIKAGWGWLTMLRYSDFINFVGVAILAGVTMICYLSIVPLLFKSKDYVYAFLAVLEVIVLLVAASGIISLGIDLVGPLNALVTVSLAPRDDSGWRKQKSTASEWKVEAGASSPESR